jgi:hypothetical protein
MVKKVEPPKEELSSLTLDIAAAAAYVHSSRSAFRRRFINTGLLQPIDLGGRSPCVLRSKLEEAVLKIAAEQAADPSLRKLRSGGAVLAARKTPGNPWGRNGKPADVARAEKAAKAQKVSA